MGRPKGRKDQKPRKTKGLTPEQRSEISKRSAATRRRKIEEKNKAEQQVTSKPAVNKEFEKKLDDIEQPKQQDRAALEPPVEIFVADVAEFVEWPFVIWSNFNKLPDLKLTSAESVSVAEPLTRILNRHQITKTIPPDWLDGLLAAGRLSPIMQQRFELIKEERARRKAEQGGSDKQAGVSDQGGSGPAMSETK